MRVAGRTLSQRTPRTSVWRRLVAALVNDTHLQPRIAGARAVAVEQQRLLYEAGGTEIDLEVGESQITGRLRMLGQVPADEPHLVRAWVVVDGPSGRLEAEIDGLGRFSFDGLVSGVHRLEIGLAREMIEIPSIQL